MGKIKTVQIGQLVTSDFEENTLTFEMSHQFTAKAGVYVIMDQSVFTELKRVLKSCKISLQTYPNNEPNSEFDGFVSLANGILNNLDS